MEYTYPIATEQEHFAAMSTMAEYLTSQDEPKVGIFWYDEGKDELFGVSKVEASSMQFNSNGLKTIKTLHKTWWQKEKNRALSRGKDPGIYKKDYTLVPRGRIFQREDGVYQLMCGSWINESIVDMVKYEFDLQDVPFELKIDEHWELGHGWSEEYFN